MIRVTNKKDQATKIQYVDRQVDRIVEVPIEAKAPDAIIQYIDRETIREIPVPGDTIIMEKETASIDLQPIHDKHTELETSIQKLGQIHNNLANSVINELEMQRRALVSLKMQRDVDRKRRLTLIQKLRKAKNKQAETNKRFHFIGAAALVLIILSHLIR